MKQHKMTSFFTHKVTTEDNASLILLGNSGSQCRAQLYHLRIMKLEHLSTKSLSVICPELIPGALTLPLLACFVHVGLLLSLKKVLQPERLNCSQ